MSIEAPKNPLLREHLKEGVSPIVACLVPSGGELSGAGEAIQEIIKNGEFVDFYGKKEYLETRLIKSAGPESYVVSDVNDKDKYSKQYANCTGMLLVGKDKKTGNNISFLTHHNPDQVINDYAEQPSLASEEEFKQDVRMSIKKLIECSELGTIDAVVFGGNDALIDEYIDSIKLSCSLIKESLGFEPVVLTGPNISPMGRTHVYFDNNNRRLYVVRPKQESKLNESYLPSDVEKMSDEWPV